MTVKSLQLKDSPFIRAFFFFLTTNVLAASFSPIHDCDETFNYWEPTHYLNHGYGLQTWEYSPEYAIRSWLYISLHAMIGRFRMLFPSTSKTKMFQAISNIFNLRIAIFFLISMVFSPGMYHASVSFLPSSFSMYTAMLGITAFMDWRGVNTVQAITWFSVGGIIGWPFSMALCIPFLIEEVVLAHCRNKDAIIQLVLRFTRGISASLLTLVFEILISGLFYKRLVIVPLNIVLYNVLNGPGPDLYGTEAWHFYIRNLLLNFNIWFILALFSIPLYILQKLILCHKPIVLNGSRGIIFMIPFYIWLVLFSCQPHKEERFMYPMYPCLALNAGISLHILLSALGNSNRRVFPGNVPAWIKLLILVLIFITSLGMGISRIYGIYTGYSAPLHIYEPLMTDGSDGDTVCFGKEWHRFPSSYHLPKNIHAKFIKSEFKGLLPGEYLDAVNDRYLRSGTSLTPSGMNNQNLEDEGKYSDIGTCDFLVDTYFPNSNPSYLEPHFILDSTNWEVIRCATFLDASRTPLLGRVFWIPELPWFIPDRWHQAWSKKFERSWGRHCLLKQKKELPSN